MSNLHPMFESILKPHLQGQAVVARKRDTIRYNALHKGWQECGDLISFGTFVAAVDKYEATRDEAHLDAQFEAERKPASYYLGTKCWRDYCGHARGEHDEAGCRGGEDTICRCTDFVEPVEDEKEAEREVRRQYREWRNDSGV